MMTYDPDRSLIFPPAMSIDKLWKGYMPNIRGELKNTVFVVMDELP